MGTTYFKPFLEFVFEPRFGTWMFAAGFYHGIPWSREGTTAALALQRTSIPGPQRAAILEWVGFFTLRRCREEQFTEMDATTLSDTWDAAKEIGNTFDHRWRDDPDFFDEADISTWFFAGGDNYDGEWGFEEFVGRRSGRIGGVYDWIGHVEQNYIDAVSTPYKLEVVTNVWSGPYVTFTAFLTELAFSAAARDVALIDEGIISLQFGATNYPVRDWDDRGD
jgi:hypothetical protein